MQRPYKSKRLTKNPFITWISIARIFPELAMNRFSC